MRAVLGIVSLMLVLAVVGLLAKKQLSATRMAVPALQQPAPLAGADGAAPPAPASVRDQSLHIQQQYKQTLEGLVQQPRPLPDDAH